MSELQNIWKKKQKKKFENHVCYPLSTWKNKSSLKTMSDKYW